VWTERTRCAQLDADRAYLIVAVEEASAETVAAELGLEPSRVLPEIHDGLHALARLVEEVAWEALGEGDEAADRRAKAARALAGQRRPAREQARAGRVV
jgi:hypothetical protein